MSWRALLTVNKKLPTLWWLPRTAVPLRPVPLVVPLVAIVCDLCVREDNYRQTMMGMRQVKREREEKRFKRGEKRGEGGGLAGSGAVLGIILGESAVEHYFSEKGIIHGKTARAMSDSEG